MPDVEVDRSCAGNAFAAAKRPRVGFGSGTKAWDGLSKPSAVLHDIFIDLLRSGLSVCSGSTLMAVVQRRWSTPARPQQATTARPDIMEGTLFKRGGGTSLFGRKNWKERYFVLGSDAALRYYESEAAYKAKPESPLKMKAMSVKGAEAHRIEGDDLAGLPDGADPSQGFSIDTASGRTLLMMCAPTGSPKSAQLWMRAFKASETAADAQHGAACAEAEIEAECDSEDEAVAEAKLALELSKLPEPPSERDDSDLMECSRANVEAIFRWVDVNNDGEIQVVEFTNAASGKHRVTMRKAGVSLSKRNSYKIPGMVMQISDFQKLSLFQSLDIDGNSSISLEEWVLAFENSKSREFQAWMSEILKQIRDMEGGFRPLQRV
ncbi:hypothetical protein FNF28_01713 [Cafeteria roenbergensis]|uniref:Uncharacterized protein n=1 Tax=Cafeteria roenbergensis TaxID=33653 RepID=A0A5A8DZF7_CAFRO|nr:hypothetical protein FNF28_01713 [Cafeteria roenbergensis]